MNFIKEHIEYLKDNPHGYWFKAKLYGWGWVPARWEGWAVIAVFVVIFASILVPFVQYASVQPEPELNIFLTFLFKVVLSVTVLLTICYKMGEKPRWQWGLPKEKK